MQTSNVITEMQCSREMINDLEKALLLISKWHGMGEAVRIVNQRIGIEMATLSIMEEDAYPTSTEEGK